MKWFFRFSRSITCVGARGRRLARVLLGLQIIHNGLFAQATDLPQRERYALVSDKAVSSLLLDICRLPGSDRLVVVGDRGHILFSDDSGKHWTQSRVPTTQMLTAVSFPSAKTGYAVGHDNIILKTDDAGENWQRVYQNIDLQAPLLDVWFQSESKGMAVGAYGVVLQTADGGKTWKNISTAIENEDEFHLNAIASDGADNVFLAGETGILYRSTNKGQTWQTLASPYDGSLFGVSANADQVLIHGLRGNVFHSVNQGDSWKQVSSGTRGALFGSAMIDDGSSFIVGKSGSMLVGKERRWQIQFRQNRVTLMALATAPDGTIIVVGQNGVHRTQLTVNAGQSTRLPEAGDGPVAIK